MATAIGDLVIRLGAQTSQFDKRMRSARGQVRTMGPATARMGTMMAGGFATATAGVHALTASLMTLMGPLVGVYGAMKLLGGGEMFGRKMRQSLAIMGDVSEVMRTDMRKAAIEVAKVTKFSAAETAEAYYFLTSAGLDAKQSIVALPAVATFAQAGMFDLSRATQLLTDSLAALGMKSKDPQENLANMVRLSDMLVKANTLADASTEQFAEALSGPIAGYMRAYNISLEEGVGLLALLAERGQKGAEASDAAMVLFRDIPRAVSMNSAAFKKYGITIDDGTDNMLDMVSVVRNLTKGLGSMGSMTLSAAMQEMGLTRSVRNVILKLFEGSGELHNFQEELKKAGGMAQEVADNQLTAIQKGSAKLGAEITKIGDALVLTFGPTAMATMSRFANFLTRLPRLFSMLSEGARAWGQMFRETFSGSINTVMAFAKPLADTYADAFTVMRSHLDVMLASWEGFREGIISLTQQTTLAFMALWEKAILNIKILLLRLGGEFAILRGRIQDQLGAAAKATKEEWRDTLTFINNVMKQLLTFEGIEFPSKTTEILPGLTRAEIAAAVKRDDAESQLTKEARLRLDIENEIVKLREKSEKRLSAIGADSLQVSRRWKEKAGQLPAFSREFERLKPGVAGLPAFSPLPTVGAGSAGGAGGAGGSGSPGAFTKGSTQAWSSIMAAMNQRKKPMQDVVKNTKKTAEGIDEIVGLIQDQGSEFQEIPS
ncbi:hypothetical protein LCGC14_0954390 [marine sediment metagenome]|uniref:Phage tail tape measure protein domain-containing protein n=1 Tax=marine sediment metagenome TaxID=412755 RepID=A0A0F9NKV3_9ZZZZ